MNYLKSKLQKEREKRKMATYELFTTGATAELVAKIKSADADTLQAAKDYANSVVETGTADGATVTYVDTQDAATLASAKEYADNAVSKANHLKYVAVDSLPDTGEENTVYGVISGKSGNNKRTEYIWVDGEWEVWGTDDVDLSDYLKKTETAAAAEKLETARTIQTDLASSTAASFDGTGNVTVGITGTLGIANGGTGATTASDALANLGGVALSECTLIGSDTIDAYFA